MTALGHALLIAALPTALGGALLALAGQWRDDRRLLTASRRATYAFCGLLLGAFVVLEIGFVTDDFSFALVVGHSEVVQPLFYKLTAMWASQEGSLLLWATVLGIVATVAISLNHRRHAGLVPIATAVLLGVGAFFVALMLFAANPFTRLAEPPADGMGLMPLLRDPAMVIHPPMLYSGYVWFAVPFAFAIAALATRRLDSSWIVATRRFTLIAWAFLGFGILLGAAWSYNELGWGGYWAWDPVENASLMPWLTGTAFLHSVMVQEKRGMLKVWNVSLICATFVLALTGTLIVRSGILDSIHAFGASTVGPPLLALIVAVTLGATALILSRLDDLRSERRIDSLLSRESVFLVNNLLLVGLCFVIFWGTFFPVISELATGTRQNLGPGFFDRVTMPLAIMLVLFTGIGPILAWRRVTWRQIRGRFALPAATGFLAGALGLALSAGGGSVLSPIGRPAAIVLFAFAGFSLAAVAQEYWRGAAAQRGLGGGSPLGALAQLVGRNRRRYGGYIVHAGIAVLFIGVAASSTFQTNRDVRLQPGEQTSIAGYDITYVEPTTGRNPQFLWFGAVLEVERDGRHVATLRPERHYYESRDVVETGFFGRFFQGEAVSEVGIRRGLDRDLWAAMEPDIEAVVSRAETADRRLASLDDRQILALMTAPDQVDLVVDEIAGSFAAGGAPAPVTFRLIVNPMVSLLWVGALIGLAGSILALWPAPRAREGRAGAAAAARRLARELGEARGS